MKTQTHIIRIDAISQGNFQLRFVGAREPSTRPFRVKPRDAIRFVAYRNNGRIDYQIVFKSQQRSPFTDVDRIDMPQGGLTDPFVVTTTLTGGMKFSILIPSLGWHFDPEILVDGDIDTLDREDLLEQLEELLRGNPLAGQREPEEFEITVGVAGNAFTFSGAHPLPVDEGDLISWRLTQHGVDAPEFAINFSATSPPPSPLDSLANGIGEDHYDGKTAVVSNRIFRRLRASEGTSKDFTYVIAMKTVDPDGNMPTSSSRTIRLTKV